MAEIDFEAKPANAGPSRALQSRISVMHLIHTVAYGGVETAILNWVGRLDPHRFEVHLVCFANPGQTEIPFVHAAERRGFRVDRITWSRRKPIFRARRELIALLHQHRVDILHTHNTYADLVGVAAARLVAVKTITTLYVWSKFHWRRNLLQTLNRWLLPYFDLVSAHCEETYRRTVAAGVPESRLRLLICGYEPALMQPTSAERLRRRRALDVQDDEIVLANIARLYPEKGQKRLLQLFREIHAVHPAARLWIVGVGPLEAELRTLATSLGLDPYVRFLGFSKELPDLLASVDIQVSSSTAEGVPLAICAGMAAALPIVATDVGGLPEVLDHGRAGVLVPVTNDHAFVAAVSSLIRNPGRRVQLGLAAKHFIDNSYSLAYAVKRLEATYYEVLGQCVSASS